MNFIGDYFALGLVIILCVFFFDSKTSVRYMSAASKRFICCLITTALTAVLDLATGQLMGVEQIPIWENLLINTLYFAVNIVATSSIALYLFTIKSLSVKRSLIRIKADHASVNFTSGPTTGFKNAQVLNTTIISKTDLKVLWSKILFMTDGKKPFFSI